MTFLTAWLFLVLAFGTVALFAVWSRKPTGYRAASVVAFILAAALSLPVALAPLGAPRFLAPPPGEYRVLGARIDPDVAIYVLLQPAEGLPVYYVLPYSAASANDLQNAIDGKGEGGGVRGTFSEGAVNFDVEPPVTADEEKVAEQPMYEVQ